MSPGVRQPPLCHGTGLLEDPTDSPGVLFVPQKKNRSEIVIIFEFSSWTEKYELVILTLIVMFWSINCLGSDGSVGEGSLNSCIIQSVFIPLAALPL
jgi:hypothetical protein